MKKTIYSITILFYLLPTMIFGDVNHFLPDDIKVDQNGDLLNTSDLSKKGYAFDKKNGRVIKDKIVYQVKKNEDGNLTFSQANINSQESERAHRFSRTDTTNQFVRHIKFNSLQQVTTIVDCDSSAKYKFQLGNPLSLPISNSQQAVCSVVSADSCKIQADLLRNYFGNDQSKFFKQVSECKDMLKKVNHINEKFSGSINITDFEIDKLNSDLMKTSEAKSSLGKLLGSKFINTTHYKSSQGDSLQDVIRSVDQLKESYTTCSQFKDQMAPSSAQADSNISQKTVKPNELGKCTPPFVISRDEKECLLPSCPPGSVLDEVDLACRRPSCPTGYALESGQCKRQIVPYYNPGNQNAPSVQ